MGRTWNGIKQNKLLEDLRNSLGLVMVEKKRKTEIFHVKKEKRVKKIFVSLFLLYFYSNFEILYFFIFKF